MRDAIPDAPKKRVWATDGEWTKLISRAAKTGIVLHILEADVLRDSRGTKVLSGAFGVAKKNGKMRFIADVGSNHSMAFSLSRQHRAWFALSFHVVFDSVETE